MSKVRFLTDTMPLSGKALKQELQQALEKASPLDDFIQLIRDLMCMENKYDLESSLFYERFQEGKLGDDIELVRWANKYEIYQETKAELEYVIDLLTQYALPAAS